MTNQVPRGPDNLYCPFWRKKMSSVCHTCPNWTQVRGTNPNTGAEVDSWQCAVSILPMLLINTAKETRQGAAATESFRNEMVRAHHEAMRAQMSGHRQKLAAPVDTLALAAD